MDQNGLQELADIEAIRQLKARYFRFLDTQDWSGWRRLFTEDLHFEADGFVADGGNEFVAQISRALAGAVTVHQGHTGEITITGPDTATGIWSMSDYVTHHGDSAPGDFRGYGHYHDDYVRCTDGWRITRSVVTRLRVDPLD